MQSFTNVQILERHVNDYFEINGKQIILVSENNGKQNSDDSYTNKNQNQIGRSFGYKLVINLASLSSHS